MRSTFVLAGLLLLALTGLGTGCSSVSSSQVANPTYQAWANFEPGSSVTFKGTRKIGQDTHNVQFTRKLLEVTPQQVVLERSEELLDGSGLPPTVKRDVELARIEPADNPWTNPQARVKDLGDDSIQIKGKTLQCKGKEVVLHVEFGEPLPTTEDALHRKWVNPEIPGGTVKMFLDRKSTSHDVELSIQAIEYQVVRRKTQ